MIRLSTGGLCRQNLGVPRSSIAVPAALWWSPISEAAVKRRDLLAGAGALALASIAKAAPPKSPDAHHHEGGPQPLVDAAADCLRKGEVCQQHCFTLLGSGDTSMA